ncbi:MAG: YicC family protein [Rhizobiales bacterium]|nr:YicC family protein [Hyphomicrobiales bacterium]
MAITSMTGFARIDGTIDALTWHWEIKSVNGKGFDTRCRLPSGYEAIEPAVREIAGKHVRRGNLQISLQIGRDTATSTLRVNEEALAQILPIADDLRERLGAPAVTVEGILSIRGVLEMGEAEETEEARDARHAAILKDFSDACASLAAMRKAEGENLARVIAGQLDTIEKLTGQARDCPARSADAIKARLSDQISRLMEASDTFDADRLHQEAVLIAAKSDIQEELDRLFAHVEAGRELLASDQPVGRKFDFVAQEFNREANTLCSKSTDQSLTKIGLELKTVIDQLREQVQNIE